MCCLPSHLAPGLSPAALTDTPMYMPPPSPHRAHDRATPTSVTSVTVIAPITCADARTPFERELLGRCYRRGDHCGDDDDDDDDDDDVTTTTTTSRRRTGLPVLCQTDNCTRWTSLLNHTCASRRTLRELGLIVTLRRLLPSCSSPRTPCETETAPH